MNKPSRREIGTVLAAVVLPAVVPAGAAGQAPVDTNRALAEQLAAVRLPDSTEPSLHFKA